MKIKEALQFGIQILAKKRDKFSSPELDAEILLAKTLDSTREKLLSQAGATIKQAAFARFRRLLARRASHEPIAYITGRKHFFNLELRVKKGACLIPRPETEILVERAVAILDYHPSDSKKHLVIDVGTGSGAIALTVAKNCPKEKIMATDTNRRALAVAKENAKLLGIKNVRFHRVDLLPDKLPINKPLLILANLPYLTAKQWKILAPEIRCFEPKNALIGGKDGLVIYRRLIAALKRSRPAGLFVLLAEIDPKQFRGLKNLIRKNWPDAAISAHRDLRNKIRVIESVI